MAEGKSGLRDLRRHQSCPPFIRSDLDGRVRTSRNPRERNQPWTIETPMFDAQFSTNALKEQFKANIPLHRLGLPEEIASAALFLASKESSYISGIDLPVDGGLVSV